jgi:hypothetical protein
MSRSVERATRKDDLPNETLRGRAIAPILVAIDAQVAAALLTAIASLLVALVGGAWLLYRQKEIAKLEHKSRSQLTQLEHELREREARSEWEREAEKVLTRYREPLIAASYDLQRRLYNIIDLKFLDVFMTPENAREEEAVETTLYRMAQYFGWTEILRRDIQFLKFREAEVTRAVAKLQGEIAHKFASDSYGHAFMLWQDEQRAIGELMIVRENGSVGCRGYASFQQQREAGEWSRLERLEQDFRSGNARAAKRLKEIQHNLCELVELLDKDQLLYDRATLKRASGG